MFTTLCGMNSKKIINMTIIVNFWSVFNQILVIFHQSLSLLLYEQTL